MFVCVLSDSSPGGVGARSLLSLREWLLAREQREPPGFKTRMGVFSHIGVCFFLEPADWLEKGVLHGLGRRDAAVLVVDEHFVEQVDPVLRDARIIVLVDDYFRYYYQEQV